MSYRTKNIRNISLVGHGQTGKTTLMDAMLFTSHIIPEMGSIEKGTTVGDYREQEIEKKISIHSSVSHLIWEDHEFNIIDTPGISDFSGDVFAALRASDSAVFLVSADAGVEIETIKIWRKCELPRMVFINKMDKENADYEKTLQDLKDTFKDTTFVPLSIPVGHGSDFTGIVDLIDGEARYFEEKGKKIRKEKAPEHMEGLDVHLKEMLEVAVETDETLMEKYFNGEELTHDEKVHGLKKAIVQGKIVPVICGDALINAGTLILLNGIMDYMPSPADVDPIIGKDNQDEDVIVEPNADQDLAFFVFKTSVDQFSGKISYFRVRRGTVVHDAELYNPRSDGKVKCTKLYKILGKKLIETDDLKAGDIGAFTKLDDIHTNDTICSPDCIVKLPEMHLPQPIYSLAIEAVNKKDEEKLITLLQKESEEDPTFRSEFHPETKENVVSGMGETQIRFILDKIKSKYKIEAKTDFPKIAYRETIQKSATAEYTHKKQSGGHGQYGRVNIEIWPLEDETMEYEFVNAIVGGAVSKGYIPGCEKGFHEAMQEGVLAGFKVVGVGVKLFDGKEHPVDSSEMAFKLASRSAFNLAMEQAKPVLLEPVYELDVYVDQDYVGDILSDISSKRGRVIGQEDLSGGITIIKALVPLSELQRYAIDLKSITSGTGSFELSFNGYQKLVGKLADDVIAAKKG